MPVTVRGDVPALGRLLITETQGVDRYWLVWGIRSRYYDASVDAALFYEAEGRTALNGAATAVGTAPASGGGSNVVRSVGLTTNYAGVVSTQASGGGNHLRHVGDFQVFARVFVPVTAGTRTVALDWAEGDFRQHTINAGVSLGVPSGTWSLVDLGQVHLTKVTAGTQRWEGRVLAKSTVPGATIDIDCLFLIPVSEASGRVQAALQFETPTSFTARDEFNQTAGALVGKTAPVGGNWSGAGSAGDFSVVAGSMAERTTLSDGNYRWERLGTGTPAAITVQADLKFSAIPSSGLLILGAMARYVDTSNFFDAYLSTSNAPYVSHVKVDGYAAGASLLALPSADVATRPNTWYTIRLSVDAGGRFAVWFFPQGAASGGPLLTGQNAALATGGALASGGFGLVDSMTAASPAITRDYANFFAFPATPDAAIFAGRQLEIRHDRVMRQDSTGTTWQQPSKYEGDFLRLPPSGREGRKTEIIVLASRNDPTTMADSGIDDLSATLYSTPRWLVTPD